MNDGLLLLLQERDQLLPGTDVALDAPVGVVEEADDGGLFGKGWHGTWKILEVAPIEVLAETRAKSVEDFF